jgi:hypothetical protein
MNSKFSRQVPENSRQFPRAGTGLDCTGCSLWYDDAFTGVREPRRAPCLDLAGGRMYFDAYTDPLHRRAIAACEEARELKRIAAACVALAQRYAADLSDDHEAGLNELGGICCHDRGERAASARIPALRWGRRGWVIYFVGSAVRARGRGRGSGPCSRGSAAAAPRPRARTRSSRRRGAWRAG